MPAERLFSRAVIRLSAQTPDDDVTTFLQGLVTNDVSGLLPVWTALLTPQGKVLFDFLVWPGADGLLLDCEARVADDLVRRLSLYRLRRKITIARDEGVGVYWQAELGDGGAADPRLPALGQRWIARVSDDDESADEAWMRHRLALGVPEGQAELGNGETLWLECNAVELNGVSFTKGCYVGQENTARMNWRQKINRRLLVVPLEASQEKRQRIAYPELRLAIDHLRTDDIADGLLPRWLRPSDTQEASL